MNVLKNVKYFRVSTILQSTRSSVYHTRLRIRGSWVQWPGSMDFSERKNPEYDFLWKGSKAVGPCVVDLQHVKEPQAKIRASEQNLSDFPCSM